jgi:glycine/D-amino acid oxidase-like deaminating enzyme
MSSRREVTVVGAGVIGLTCAHALREAGYEVTVLAANRARVSDVAGGLWLPYAAGDSADVLRWALETPAVARAAWIPTARVPTSASERAMVAGCNSG